MQVIYITSTVPFSGKTALCYGLAARMQQDGLRVGYFQPLDLGGKRVGPNLISEDATFMGAALRLSDPPELLAPVVLDAAALEQTLTGPGDNYAARIDAAFFEVRKNKEVVVVEGAGSLAAGLLLNLPPPQIVERLNARVLALVKYTDALALEGLLAAQLQFGPRLLGTVINQVSPPGLEFVETTVVPFLERRELPVYAALHRDPLLLALTVNEIAEFLDAEILNSPEQGEELVENLLVGAMTVDRALSYFRRQPYKAVITGGDRSDIQLAALETSTRCIILTGNILPSPIVLSQAEELGVPMLLAKQDTLSVVETLERYFGKLPFHQPRKVRRFQELLTERLDFQKFYADLGIKGK